MRARIAVLVSGTGTVVAALLVARSVGLAAAIALTAAELPLMWLAIGQPALRRLANGGAIRTRLR